MVSQPAGALGLVVLTGIAASASTSLAMLVGAAVLAVAAPLYLVGRRPAPVVAESDGSVVHGGVSGGR
jgi:hypothetical protein